MRQTTVTINLSALAHNVQRVKQYAPTAQVMAMVKANAYGHGAVACLPAFDHIDALGVACLTEALALRQAHWTKKIVIIEGAFSEPEWQTCLEQHIDCVIHQQNQLDWALAHLPTSSTATVWLKFNTGMNRLGFDEDEILPIAKQLHEKGYQVVLTSHFANADVKDHPSNHAQIAKFDRVLSQLKQQVSPTTIQGSLCNSAGIINFPKQHHDWVRAGIMLYGATPLADASADKLNLQPVMQFDAQIMATHELQVGECVGYGSRWQADKPSHIAIVSVGYADGYPRVVNQSAYVTANDKKLPIIGRVAMDMLMVDITGVADMDVGTSVQLWGESPCIDEVANWNDTIGYELMCLVTQRPIWRWNK
ncbi:MULTISPECIES: alanine racemase [unclassified Moraxella]|uniref:alanine racemase n=1 Tax=unclassified Moraxella TaxID=2685852 RepID=UPI003AF6CD1C